MEIVPAPYGTDLWRVARVDTVLITDDQQTELFAWLDRIGVPFRSEVTPMLAISQDAVTRRLLLHLSRFVLDAAGEKVIDHAANRMHTEPVAYAITDYPPFLVGVSHQQQSEREAHHVGAGSDQ